MSHLRKSFSKFATGVCVVTINTPDGPMGMTVNSFSSISLEPAIVSWAIANSSERYSQFIEATHMSIHVLKAERSDLCMAFSKRADAFEAGCWGISDLGTPVIEDMLARFDIEVMDRIAAGDHKIILGEVLHFEHSSGDPLIFFDGKFDR